MAGANRLSCLAAQGVDAMSQAAARVSDNLASAGQHLGIRQELSFADGLGSVPGATNRVSSSLNSVRDKLLKAESRLGSTGSNAADEVVKKASGLNKIDNIEVIDGRVGGKIPVDDFQKMRQSSLHNTNADSMTLGKYTPTIENGVPNWSKAGPDSYIGKA